MVKLHVTPRPVTGDSLTDLITMHFSAVVFIRYEYYLAKPEHSWIGRDGIAIFTWMPSKGMITNKTCLPRAAEVIQGLENSGPMRGQMLYAAYYYGLREDAGILHGLVTGPS